MRQRDTDQKQTVAETNAPAARGEKAFAVFDYAIKVVKVSVVVLGLMIVAIALSGVDMARLDEHEIFQYRMVAAPAIILGYLLIDYLLARRRAGRAAEAAARSGAANARNKFVSSAELAADRRAAQAAAAANEASQVRPKRSYAVEFMALAFVAAGGVAFWHDHMSNEIPDAVAVPAKFVSAKCVDRSGKTVVVGPHMSIGYEFVSRSTRVRESGVTCLLDNCEAEKKPPEYTDTEYKRVFYASLSQCQAALPAVLAAKEPTTVWTGDKDPNASVRARFTPERDQPPYFLLWFPSAVAAVVLLISAVARRRGTR